VESQTGISLTGNFAMQPAASVSGWYFNYPGGKYFKVAKIREDQIKDYAERIGITMNEAIKHLGENYSK
jgi:5-methyltetrahydrofolate--homocysteine methyltransferase